jgi:two-component system sensor histidine kinase CpxA
VLLALAIGISGLISYLLARSIASPLQDLQGAARSLSTGNLAARSNAKVAHRRDELGTLAREFDSMAERLSDLITARQQLLRDISHELRSPLARLQMALQLLRQDASSTESQLDRIERESERLEMLIDQVLEYARLERDPATLKLEEVDLIELTRQIVHDATFESQSAPDRLQFMHPESTLVRADPNLLHAVIDNVVRNAMIHGGETSEIDIAVAESPHEITLTVRDHGSGVPESELQKIFEPFYRVVDSISHKARNEGSGIGLAIAARAMALHGGRITAENASGGGLMVTMILPRLSHR